MYNCHILIFTYVLYYIIQYKNLNVFIENEEEFCPLNNFDRRGRGRQSGGMDKRNSPMSYETMFDCWFRHEK